MQTLGTVKSLVVYFFWGLRDDTNHTPLLGELHMHDLIRAASPVSCSSLQNTPSSGGAKCMHAQSPHVGGADAVRAQMGQALRDAAASVQATDALPPEGAGIGEFILGPRDGEWVRWEQTMHMAVDQTRGPCTPPVPALGSLASKWVA
eukprot:1071562-Pelagomonas_calceolata.AAC.1